jgi:exonuclease III
MNGAIYGVKQTVFSVYALTNKSDNAAEMDNFYSTLERQVSAVRTRVETKIVILGDFNARVGTDGSDNATEENNETGTSDSRKPMIMEQNYSLSV